MGLNFFKKAKVDNSKDLEGLSVTLPKSKKEITIEELVELGDKVMNMAGYAAPEHMVKFHDGQEMSVGDIVAHHKNMCDEMESKKNDEEETELKEEKKEVDSESTPEMKNEEDGDEKEDKKKENDDAEDKQENDEEMGDEEAKKKALQLAEHEDKEIEAEKKKNALEKKKQDKAKADKLRNAHLKVENEDEEVSVIELSSDKVARGKARYGSN